MPFAFPSLPVRALIAAGALALFAGACQSTSTGGVATGPTHSRNTIVAEEWRDLPVTNLYDVVQHLHPEWLAQRAAMTAGRTQGLTDETSTDVSVYIDNTRIGDSKTLKGMQLTSASAMHYYSAAESQTRFGTSNFNGVIQVVTMQ